MAEYQCKECEKSFDSKQALEMHVNSKHYKAPKVKINKKKMRNYGILLLIVLVIAAASYGLTLRENLPGKYDDFAQCITESGAKEFGAFWCPNCKAQQELFGRSFKYIDYVECSLPNQAQNELCKSEGITGYPTWEFGDGSRQEGYITLQQLAEKTGCELN